MGKRTKQEKRRLRQERQEAERRAERRRNLITVVVVAGIVMVGGVLVWASASEEPAGDPDPGDAELDEPEDPEDDGPDEGAAPGEDGEETSGEVDDRPVACEAEQPAAAGETKPTFDEPDEVLGDADDARARLATSCGEIVLDLDVARAPEAANSFAFLAEEGFYDGLEFFRTRPGLELVQAGSGDNSATWDIGYTLPAELDAAQADGYPPGAVALAVPEGEPEAGGSQFFVVYGEAFTDALLAGAVSAEYPRFATVIDGLDVVERIGDLGVAGPGGEQPAERVYIETVEIEVA